MRIKKTEVIKNIILLEFDNKKDLTLSLCRMQEFYESPHKNINNKKFSHEDFLDTYMNNAGEIDYFNKWSGFNIPSNIIDKWSQKNFSDIKEKENEVLSLIKNYLISKDKFYLIAAEKGEIKTINHEIAHGLYFINKKYKKEINDVLKHLDSKNKNIITKKLINMGYGANVIQDEIHAYLTTGDKEYIKQKFGINYTSVKDVCEALSRIFNNYKNEYK